MGLGGSDWVGKDIGVGFLSWVEKVNYLEKVPETVIGIICV